MDGSHIANEWIFNAYVWAMFRYQERFRPGRDSSTPSVQPPAPQLEGKSASFISRFRALAGGGGSRPIEALRLPSQQFTDGGASEGKSSPSGKSGQVDDEVKSQV